MTMGSYKRTCPNYSPMEWRDLANCMFCLKFITGKRSINNPVNVFTCFKILYLLQNRIMVYSLRPRKNGSYFPAKDPKPVPRRKGQRIQKKQNKRSPSPKHEVLGESSRARTAISASTQTLSTTPAPNCSSLSFPIGKNIHMNIHTSWHPKKPREDSVEKIYAGDDAFFISWSQRGVTIGLADGVGGVTAVREDEPCHSFIACTDFHIFFFPCLPGRWRTWQVCLGAHAMCGNMFHQI
jgi:hypothetical protein